MSGSVKAGLLFGLIAIPITIGMSIIPYIGVLCCGPLAAIGLGTAAGYLGGRWDAERASVVRGLIGGGFAAGGAMLGPLLFFILIIALLSSQPEFRDILRQSLAQNPQTANLTPDQQATMLQIAGPVAGLCVGTLNAFFALGGGLLGAWLLVRQRRQADAPAAV